MTELSILAEGALGLPRTLPADLFLQAARGAWHIAHLNVLGHAPTIECTPSHGRSPAPSDDALLDLQNGPVDCGYAQRRGSAPYCGSVRYCSSARGQPFVINSADHRRSCSTNSRATCPSCAPRADAHVHAKHQIHHQDLAKCAAHRPPGVHRR